MLKRLFIKYQHLIVYVFFGVLTTAVNFAVYYPLYNLCDYSAAFSNGVAWCVAVIFAFLTNKPFVFCSKDWSPNVAFPEFWKFVVSRVGSGLLETGAIYLLVDIIKLNGNAIKVLISIAVVILNYLTGKFLVFKNK